MEDKLNFIEPLFEKAREYGKTSFELFKLKALDKTAGSMSTIVSRGLVVFAFAMFITILNIGVSLWLGELLGRLYYGFFCVAGFYALLGIVLYFFLNKWIKKRVSNSIILQILN